MKISRKKKTTSEQPQDTAADYQRRIAQLREQIGELSRSITNARAGLVRLRDSNQIHSATERIGAMTREKLQLEAELEQAEQVHLLLEANEAEAESEAMGASVEAALDARKQAAAELEKAQKAFQAAEQRLADLQTKRRALDQHAEACRKAWQRRENGPAPIDRTPEEKRAQRGLMAWMTLRR